MDYLKSISKLRSHLCSVSVESFLIDLKLVPTTKNCNICGSNCRVESKGLRNSESTWRCMNRRCRKRFSIRAGSFFAKFDTPLILILEVIVGWLLKYSTNTILRESGVCKDTVNTILSEVRSLISVWLLCNSNREQLYMNVIRILQSNR
jgi:transposase-like protein